MATPTAESARALPQEHGEHAALGGAERDADANLLRPLNDGVGHDPVHADDGHDERDACEAENESGEKARLSDVLVDGILHGLHAGHGDRGRH